jgi:hypothetical protein
MLGWSSVSLGRWVIDRPVDRDECDRGRLSVLKADQIPIPTFSLLSASSLHCTFAGSMLSSPGQNSNTQLHPEKSLAQLDPSTALQTLALNSLGHLLLYKHISQFVPTARQFQAGLKDNNEGEDPARGWIRPDGGVWLSTSARVGSIGDNRKGGWYSYRA